MANVFGSKSLCLNQELSELNAILKLLSHMLLSVILILLILLKKVFLFVLWKTSLIKSNIQFNGLEIILKVLSLNLLLNFQASLRIEKTFWLSLKSNTSRTQQLSEPNSNLYINCTMPIKRKVMLLVLSWQFQFSKISLIIKSNNFWLLSQLITSSNRLENFSGVD